jgi:hypothetical protein
MRIALLLYVFLLPVSAQELTCEKFKTTAYEVLDGEYNAPSSLYADLPFMLDFSENDTAGYLETQLLGEKHPIWSVIISCKNSQDIFFSLKIMGEDFEALNGFYRLKNGHYLSGPHSLIDSKVVIIQSDKK